VNQLGTVQSRGKFHRELKACLTKSEAGGQVPQTAISELFVLATAATKSQVCDTRKVKFQNCFALWRSGDSSARGIGTNSVFD
jgi:hypothetical protein